MKNKNKLVVITTCGACLSAATIALLKVRKKKKEKKARLSLQRDLASLQRHNDNLQLDNCYIENGKLILSKVISEGESLEILKKIRIDGIEYIDGVYIGFIMDGKTKVLDSTTMNLLEDGPAPEKE